MFIMSNPQDNTYEELIDLAFDICDGFILVVRKDIFYNQNVDYILEELKASLIEVKEQWNWCGTSLSGEVPAQVHYYDTDMKARKIIKFAANSLYSWVQPDLPEDLSFIKGGKPWLINTSHEFESHIITESKEEINKILQIRGLDIRQ